MKAAAINRTAGQKQEEAWDRAELRKKNFILS
jgi:hypothetical protein